MRALLPLAIPSPLFRRQLLSLEPLLRPFSTSSTVYKRPKRPEPTGEVIAHFPQKRETFRMKESGKMYATRWKQYIDDLSKSATPRRISGGRDFGSRVRDYRRSSEPRDGKKEEG